ncbi:fructosamine kinase family protein [Nakamurella aerolata]|uniref:Phosphotransferase n=1 Tax=Nakamurella aerolata TaxID=1656892 RepID=A0A849A0N1_9ACTN|nr:phosphotransferase [Nakamurella aerolata]
MSKDFRKTRSDAPKGFFEFEAAGLSWLAAAGGAKTVPVVAVEPEAIVLQRLISGPVTAAAAEEFGAALAVTHDAGAEAFGSPPDGWQGAGWIGRQRQAMDPTPTWGAFYAQQRVRPFVEKAVRNGNLDAAGASVVDALCDRIAAGEFDDDRSPARLHGDLWSGNVQYTDNGVVLIDPAAHGGHPLTDIAMLHLFGAPGLDRITAAYLEANPIQQWRELLGLHQLHPLAVHAASHGPSYGAELVRTAQRYR